LIIVPGGYSVVSLSIFFLNPNADYKYSDTGSGAAGYISSGDVFKTLCQEITEKTLQLFVINSRRLGGYTK
jgi:hypothetical protein